MGRNRSRSFTGSKLTDGQWAVLAAVALSVVTSAFYVAGANMGRASRTDGFCIVVADVDDGNWPEVEAFTAWARDNSVRINLAVIPGKTSQEHRAWLQNRGDQVELGIHSWSHDTFSYLISSGRRDMARCLEAVPTARFVLAPQSYFNHFAVDNARALGLTPLLQVGPVVTKVGVTGNPNSRWGRQAQLRLLDANQVRADTLNSTHIIILHPIPGQAGVVEEWLGTVDHRYSRFVSEAYSAGPPSAIALILYVGVPGAVMIGAVLASESNRVRVRYMVGGLLVTVGLYVLIPSPDDILFPNGPMALGIQDLTGLPMGWSYVVSYAIGGVLLVIGVCLVGRTRELRASLEGVSRGLW